MRAVAHRSTGCPENWRPSSFRCPGHPSFASYADARRLMRSDWPFNFPFINSVGCRLYRGFVRRSEERQPVMKCPRTGTPSAPSVPPPPSPRLARRSFVNREDSHRPRLSFICIPGKRSFAANAEVYRRVSTSRAAPSSRGHRTGNKIERNGRYSRRFSL